MGQQHRRERQKLKRTIERLVGEQTMRLVLDPFRQEQKIKATQELCARAQRTRGIHNLRALLEELFERAIQDKKLKSGLEELGRLMGDGIRERMSQQSFARRIMRVTPITTQAAVTPAPLPMPSSKIFELDSSSSMGTIDYASAQLNNQYRILGHTSGEIPLEVSVPDDGET